jgi:hypothetical protein
MDDRVWMLWLSSQPPSAPESVRTSAAKGLVRVMQRATGPRHPCGVPRIPPGADASRRNVYSRLGERSRLTPEWSCQIVTSATRSQITTRLSSAMSRRRSSDSRHQSPQYSGRVTHLVVHCGLCGYEPGIELQVSEKATCRSYAMRLRSA